jgi:hypothetical protein
MNEEINRLKLILQSCIHVLINWEQTIMLNENSVSESELSENMHKNRFLVIQN